jgi:hypothetical protein
MHHDLGQRHAPRIILLAALLGCHGGLKRNDAAVESVDAGDTADDRNVDHPNDPDGADLDTQGRDADAGQPVVCGDRVCAADEVCLHSDVPIEPPICVSHCLSLTTDGDETDVNCGGSCPPCRYGRRCLQNGDCSSGTCVENRCSGTCDDQVLSDDETNVDCGGASCAPCAVSFAERVSYPVGTEPAALLTSDLDNDGDQDLAVVDRAGGAVWILAGDGSGVFAAPVSFPVGRRPFSVATADFNDDGAPDLATADFDDDTITLLAGDGRGSFSIIGRLILEAMARPHFVATGDLNEDGRPDLIVSCFLYNEGGTRIGANDVRVFLGNGAGTFTPGVRRAAGMNPETIAVADLDGDRHRDLAVAERGGDGVLVLLGDGTGNLAAAVRYAAFGMTSGVVAADLDGDGDLDLAASNYTYNAFGLLFGKGDGTFSAATGYDFWGRSRGLTGADFNRDGNLDLASGDVADRIVLLVGRGNGAFSPTALLFPVDRSPSTPAAADFNGDGRPDLAVACAGSSSVNVLLAR